MCCPQPRISLNCLAVESNRVLKAIMQFELMRHTSICFTVVRIDLAYFCKPLIRRAIRDEFKGGMDSHRIHRIALECNRLVSLRCGSIHVVIFESKVRNQLMGFSVLWITLDNLRRILGSLAAE